jgi:hypothetical protein
MKHLLAARFGDSEMISGIVPLGFGEGFGVFFVPENITVIMDMLRKFIETLIGFLTIIAGIYFVFQFIFGAYAWITAGGETNKLKEAREKILNAILGLIIIIAAVFLVDLIGFLIGINILSPAEQIINLWR